MDAKVHFCVPLSLFVTSSFTNSTCCDILLVEGGKGVGGIRLWQHLSSTQPRKSYTCSNCPKGISCTATRFWWSSPQMKKKHFHPWRKKKKKNQESFMCSSGWQPVKTVPKGGHIPNTACPEEERKRWIWKSDEAERELFNIPCSQKQWLPCGFHPRPMSPNCFSSQEVNYPPRPMQVSSEQQML